MVKLETIKLNNSFSFLVEEKHHELFNEQFDNIKTLASLMGYSISYREDNYRGVYIYINKGENFYIDISIKLFLFHDNRLNKIEMVTRPGRKDSRRFRYLNDYEKLFKDIIKHIE